MLQTRKLGKLPRGYNHKIPHMSAILAASKARVVLPPTINYAPANVNNFGMMLNDQLGDCTCAAFYHALQIWSLATKKPELTESDNSVLALYEQAAGYNPNDPSTDQGANEQAILEYVLKTGAPMDGNNRHQISAFYEIDPRNTTDVKQTIYECGLSYIGFMVPANIMPQDAPPPALWQYVPGQQILGGHAIILTGYDANGVDLISWGEKYKMTWQFFHAYTEESYGLVDKEWMYTTGKTPLGLTLPQLEQMMSSLH